MLTPGKSQSKVQVPEILDHLRPRYPDVQIRYTWPFDLRILAHTFAQQIERFTKESGHILS
jgi:sirohydrochlorin cobaltochelatase